MIAQTLLYIFIAWFALSIPASLFIGWFMSMSTKSACDNAVREEVQVRTNASVVHPDFEIA